MQKMWKMSVVVRPRENITHIYSNKEIESEIGSYFVIIPKGIGAAGDSSMFLEKPYLRFQIRASQIDLICHLREYYKLLRERHI